MNTPRRGEAHALQRRLPPGIDPLALYSTLTDGGTRTDTFLLERTSGPSLLMDQAAVRAECRGQTVRLHALTNGGRVILGMLAARCTERIAGSADDELVLQYPPIRGDDAETRLRAPSGLDLLRTLTSMECTSREEPFTVAALGVIAFDMTDLFEELPANCEDPLGFPDYVFWIAESLVVFEAETLPRVVCTAFGSSEAAYYDARARVAQLVERCSSVPCLPEPPPPGSAEGVDVDLDDSEYASVVARMREHIVSGDVYQVVPSRTFKFPCHDPLTAYSAIRRMDPSPYRFFVSSSDHVLFGASPETSVRVFERDGERRVEVKPIAGTRPRGHTADEDDRLEAEMRLDFKETAEHMMLVDLARNDVARVSMPGTRRVEKLMTVERYARVMHLVSSVTGTLRHGIDVFHALQACLNVGTLTGAPKIRATELLRQAERTKRGPYGGAIGWINGEGLMDTGVVIRSAVVRDGIAYVRAGAGVVYDSDPQREADETRRKASAILSALAASGKSA